MTATPNKTVVDNRLPAPGRNDPPDYNPYSCCGVALPVGGACSLTLIWLKICQVDIVVLSYH